MAKTAATFKQTDVERAIKAAKACKLAIQRIELTRDGRIVLVHSEGQGTETPLPVGSELDAWLEKNAG